MKLKINKTIDLKFFVVSYCDGEITDLYIAKNKKQVRDAEKNSVGEELEGLDFIKELTALEINKIKINRISAKQTAINFLLEEGTLLPKIIGSAGY